LTTDLKIRNFECVANGESLSAIGAKIGKDRGAVYRFMKRWQQEKTLERKKGQGRKRKTSERDDNAIIISVKRN
jgi:transposase